MIQKLSLCSCLKQQHSQVQTSWNDKTEEQDKKESQGPKGLQVAKCTFQKERYLENIMFLTSWRAELYNISENKAPVYVPFRTFCFALNSLCVLYTPAEEGQVGGLY